MSREITEVPTVVSPVCGMPERVDFAGTAEREPDETTLVLTSFDGLFGVSPSLGRSGLPTTPRSALFLISWASLHSLTFTVMVRFAVPPAGKVSMNQVANSLPSVVEP